MSPDVGEIPSLSRRVQRVDKQFSASAEPARDRERLREQQQAVGNVLRAVARGEGLQPVLEEIVDAAVRLCQGEHGQLYLREGDVFHVVSESGGQRAALEYAREHPHLRDRTSAVGRVALSNDVVQIPDVLADPDYDYGAQAIVGFRAVLGVPIVLERELIGALSIGRNVPGRFAQEYVELTMMFADQAAVAIANARLLEAVERQRTELARFVSPQVAELVSSPDGEQLLTGHRAYITCLFCDVRNFTAFAETAAPEDLLEVLREYHTALGQLIPQHQGTLEHFAGDGVMIFFNDPLPVSKHELQAVRFAIAVRERFEELATVWRRLRSELALGIGIEAGHATLGRIGFEGRYDYGALGPVTNLASRLSTHATPRQVLIGPRVYAAVEESVDAVPIGELDLKGFARPLPAFEVRGLRSAR
jgi:class 3 adenylate cyclase